MDTWVWAAIANGLVAVAYLSIAWLILGGLVRSRQLVSNRLGLATGLIFLTSAVHYGWDAAVAHAARDGVSWPLATWDFLTAGAAVYYLSLRSSYGSVLRGAQLFEDFRIRERQALELNDNIVQGLATAKYAIEAGADEASRRAIEETLVKARAIITELLGPEGSDIELGPGELRRERPATAV